MYDERGREINLGCDGGKRRVEKRERKTEREGEWVRKRRKHVR